MKTLFVFLISILSLTTSVIAQETETVEATFNEYSEGIYYFTDKDNYSLIFEQIDKSILSKYNLSGEEFKGKLFVITYESDTEEEDDDDDDDARLVNTIVNLKLVE